MSTLISASLYLAWAAICLLGIAWWISQGVTLLRRMRRHP